MSDKYNRFFDNYKKIKSSKALKKPGVVQN